MIRLEIKITIPENKTSENFLNYFLNKISEDTDSFFWQTSFDMTEMQRVSLDAVLGHEGFPFLDGEQLLCLTWDFASEREVHKACSFFESLAISWDIEINLFNGERRYSDILDIPDLE